MRLRLILQPAWVRFTVWAVFLTGWWWLFTSLQSSYEFEGAILSAIVFGGGLGGYLTVTTQSVHRSALRAVSGLDRAERAQAIDAVLFGRAPTDPDVRAAATRLGRAYLRNKTAAQLRRTQIWSWITVAVLVTAGISGAVASTSDRLLFVLLAALTAVLLPISVIRMRRIQRNVAQLSGAPV